MSPYLSAIVFSSWCERALSAVPPHSPCCSTALRSSDHSPFRHVQHFVRSDSLWSVYFCFPVNIQWNWVMNDLMLLQTRTMKVTLKFIKAVNGQKIIFIVISKSLQFAFTVKSFYIENFLQ